MKNIEGGRDTEQFRNVQESERYVIHVSGTKLFYTPTNRPFFTTHILYTPNYMPVSLTQQVLVYTAHRLSGTLVLSGR